MTAPRVYKAIAAVAADLARIGVAKRQVNADEAFAYRGIDDITNALAPLLVRHKLCILPRMLERSSVDRRTAGGLSVCVTVRAAFDIVAAADGSRHVVEVYGEAIDRGDKATAKAMTAAYKYAAMQAFCIPVEGSGDADAASLKILGDEAEPEEGWERWMSDLVGHIDRCRSSEALRDLQTANRDRLRALSKANSSLYATVGVAFQRVRLDHDESQGDSASRPPADIILSNDQGYRNGAAQALTHQ